MKITICGSLRFETQIQTWHEKLSLAGHTVYSMVVLPSQKAINGTPQKDWYTLEQKQTLDLLHLSKIEESDAVFVVDVDNYIGESTKREIEWAYIRRKTVYFLSQNDFNAYRLDYITDLWKSKGPWGRGQNE